MSPPAAYHRWRFAVKMMILFYGMLLQDHLSKSSESCGDKDKDILFISAEDTSSVLATDAEGVGKNGIKLFFNMTSNKTIAAHCDIGSFNITISCKNNKRYNLTVDKGILSDFDIVVMKNLNKSLNVSCLESPHNRTEFFRNIHKCFHNVGNTKNVRLSKDKHERSNSFNETCTVLESKTYVFNCEQHRHGDFCEPKVKRPGISLTVPDDNGPMSPDKADKLMKNLSSLVDEMGNHSTAELKIGSITGVLAKLPPQNQTSMRFGFTTSGDINILEENSDLATDIGHSVFIPKEASEMAVNASSTFAAVLLFPGMPKNVSGNYLYDAKTIGIEMNAKISNLSQSIRIHFTNFNKSRDNASCRSWTGKGPQNWITDGCETMEANGSITCVCSHLTFFAILMSPPPGNLSASDFHSLTSITSAGCGLSIFFLVIALLMHFLLRRTKASKATKILMNLFIALFFLNLTFLINESIAGLNNPIACVAIAAVMHYSLLATFSWFFMQALHLCLILLKVPEIKNYMKKVFISGWVTPAIIVIILLALQQYDALVISTNDGNSAKMCWISNPAVHRGVNISVYAVVFVFTLSIFITTVCHITRFKPAVVNVQEKSNTKTDFFSMLGLFVLFGITWACAFFAERPLLIASYYIFTILNSFQGFFLFIYYYRSSRLTEREKAKKDPQNSSSSATANTAVTSSG